MTNQLSRMEGQTSNAQMGTFGYLVGAGVGLILLPVLPLVLVLWLAAELGGNDREPEYASG